MNRFSPIATELSEPTLDPDDWAQFTRLMHQAVDDAVQYVQNYRSGPVWRPVPAAVKQRLSAGMPGQARLCKTSMRNSKNSFCRFRPETSIHATGHGSTDQALLLEFLGI